MTINARNVTYGTAGGVQINVDHNKPLDHAVAVKVQLTANYTTVARDPGAPARPSMTGATYNLDFPKTISSGTVISCIKAEADALVAAGKAVYV